jgi:hypothetical protein
LGEELSSSASFASRHVLDYAAFGCLVFPSV